MVVIILNLSRDQKSLKAEFLRSDKTEGTANLSKIDPNAQSSNGEQNLPQQISAFLGTWEGIWGGKCRFQLVVEKISLKEADVLYMWDDCLPGGFKGGQIRVTAKVDEKKATIEWGRSSVLTFTMSKDLETVDGRTVAPGDVSTSTMKRKK
jgi:hypothetical protein